MAIFVLVLLPLVAALWVLIRSMTHGEHYAPQAYYRHKRGGAPVAYGFESLGPRPRKRVALELGGPDAAAPSAAREEPTAAAVSDAALLRLLEADAPARLPARATR